MSSLALIGAVAAITFGSRYLFLSRRAASIRLGRFLDVFPVALFVALAARDLIAPEGELTASPLLAALAGAAVGGFLFRRSMLGVVGAGLAFYWAVRLFFANPGF